MNTQLYSKMINRDGTREISSEFTSTDPLDELLPWQSQKLDGGDDSPASSQYSSCGESEFERYCSANSVMGTPSLCSSVGTFQECLDSDFGSARSFGLPSSLESFSLGGRLDGKFEDRKLSSSGGFESFDGKNGVEERNNVDLGQESLGIKNAFDFYEKMDSPSSYEVNHVGTDDMILQEAANGLESLRLVDLNTALDEGLYGDDDEGSVVQWRNHGVSGVPQRFPLSVSTQETNNVEVTEENMVSLGVSSDFHSLSGVEEKVQSEMVIEHKGNCLNGLDSHSDVEYDVREAGSCSHEDKMSSRHEHSGGEDSMFGCGTDDEQEIDPYYQRNMSYPREAKSENKNSLIMSSSVAFGADDWDDFVQETGETDITSIMLDTFQETKQMKFETESNHINSTSETDIRFSGVDVPEQGVFDISISSNPVQDTDESAECIKTCSLTPVNFPEFGEVEQGEDVKDIIFANNFVKGEPVEHLKTCSVGDILEIEQDPQSQEAHLKKDLDLMDVGLERVYPFACTNEYATIDDSQVSESQRLEKSKSQLDPLSVTAVSQLCSASTEAPEDKIVNFCEDQYSLPSMVENNMKGILQNSSDSVNLFEDHPTPIKTENLELNELYDEVVLEMEEILLDSGESPGATFTQGNRMYQSQISMPLRDGGSTASTSGMDNAYLLIQRPLRIDEVEVVGAKQKKGDVSLGERLVGVKEYTVYIIRVWSGNDQWEVERRYRDFCTLYRRLRTLFADQGWILPSPWSSVERESRKIFGNVSPDVVAERSVLIQECLRSIIHSRFSSSLPSTLTWFLSPPKDLPSSPASNTDNSPSPFSTRGAYMENVSSLGKTISLIIEIRPYKSMKQILEAQHFTCAGCHKHFDDGKTRMREFVQTLGWGKPRFCEYTGQLFCSSCHTNETAVLPARVLHNWDFTQYLVSQMAKSYLDSIHDQPMLCVSAVNPFLSSKVPALQHITGVRRKIVAMLPYVHCPFRRSIYKAIGSRRYLLESNDFFALKDLVDLSKGVFAALPVMVETVSSKILEHITEQCLICCDVGVPCNARQACYDPSSLIFPFQEGEIERCGSCKSVFHKPCFKKITSCPCGANLKTDKTEEWTTEVSHNVGSEMDGTLGALGKKPNSRSSGGFLSGLFSRARQENILGHKDSDTVILMGSLPSTSL